MQRDNFAEIVAGQKMTPMIWLWAVLCVCVCGCDAINRSATCTMFLYTFFGLLGSWMGEILAKEKAALPKPRFADSHLFFLVLSPTHSPHFFYSSRTLIPCWFYPECTRLTHHQPTGQVKTTVSVSSDENNANNSRRIHIRSVCIESCDKNNSKTIESTKTTLLTWFTNLVSSELVPCMAQSGHRAC